MKKFKVYISNFAGAIPIVADEVEYYRNDIRSVFVDAHFKNATGEVIARFFNPLGVVFCGPASAQDQRTAANVIPIDRDEEERLA